MNGKKTYIVVGVGIVYLIVNYFWGPEPGAFPVEELLTLLGLAGIRHGMKTKK